MSLPERDEIVGNVKIEPGGGEQLNLTEWLAEFATQISSQLKQSSEQLSLDFKQSSEENTDRLDKLSLDFDLLSSHLNEKCEEIKTTLSKNTSEQLIHFRKEFQVKVESLNENIQANTDSIAVIYNRVDTEAKRLDQRIDKTSENLKQEYNLYTTNVDTKVENIHTKCTQLEDALMSKQMFYNQNTMYGHIQVKCFPGENLHPIDFIHQCKDMFVVGMSDNIKIKLVKRFLEGEALSWANENNDSWNTFEEFEAKFICKFWSQSIQARLKSEFLNGPVYRGKVGGMQKFCRDQLKKLAHLNNSFDIITQIDVLKRRLPERLQWELVHGPDDSMEEFLKFVDRLDRALERESNQSFGSGNNQYGGWSRNVNRDYYGRRNFENSGNNAPNRGDMRYENDFRNNTQEGGWRRDNRNDRNRYWGREQERRGFVETSEQNDNYKRTDRGNQPGNGGQSH
ncbi:uncharacterized protein LOC126260814 [Schistocerca nitens]|uniref:uncharacterized protein LOC126260813 n=1 Tax=Schistocerca nitens TaxID=7011 RepID=UPI002118F90C|nr:uncharacterized protein LOC126260813 [Schistocerca nitens]XP_049814144.1 uncharacterized protein LOC126260814 [Schistocerca nitens]